MCYFSGLGVSGVETIPCFVAAKFPVPQRLTTYTEPETSALHVKASWGLFFRGRSGNIQKGTKRCGEHLQQSQSPVTVR